MRAVALFTLALLVGCTGPDIAAPLAPSLDFYAACKRLAIFMLDVDGQPVGPTGIFAFNLLAIDGPVSVPTTIGEHAIRYIELAVWDGHILSLVDTTLTVIGPTRVDMACAP